MSEFHVETVRIGPVQKHPNADTLSVTNIHDGYPVVFKTGDFTEGDIAVYVPVDALVPSSRPEFAFLGSDKSMHRIRARKLRGVFSMGLLVKPPPEGNIEALGVEKYLPPMEREPSPPRKFEQTRRSRRSETRRFDLGAIGIGAIVALCLPWWMLPVVVTGVVVAIHANRRLRKKPNVPVYDIEGFRRYKGTFLSGEDVVITEKIHGCNARYVYAGFQFWVGSRTQWRDGDSLWHRAAEKYDLERKMRKYPGFVLFGEIYGADCQDLDYGVPKGDVAFCAFDIMDSKTREFLSYATFRKICTHLEIPMAPTLYRGPWSDDLLALAEGKTTYGEVHVREGIVVRPMHEATVPGLGRKQLKLAGQGYLLR